MDILCEKTQFFLPKIFYIRLCEVNKHNLALLNLEVDFNSQRSTSYTESKEDYPPPDNNNLPLP